MVGKKKTELDIKPRPNTYFGDRFADAEKFCKGKTKDEQIKDLKLLLADSQTRTRMSLDGWGSTLKSWKFWSKIKLVQILVAVLWGFCLGIIIFA